MTAEKPDQPGEAANEAGSPPKAPPRFAYMDATEAAANLRTDRLTVMNFIKEGRLRTFGGRPNNPFVRTDAVERLAQELLKDLKDAPPVDPKVVHRNDPVRKLKLRIQQDAKWPEVDEPAMRAWAAELDPISYRRMRKVAQDAIDRLQLIIKVLDELDEKKNHR